MCPETPCTGWPGRWGIIAFPMKALLNDGKEFTFYYAISGTSLHPFEIKIHPIAGRDFILSDILTPGISTSFNKRENKLNTPVYVVIKDGEITMSTERIDIVRSRTSVESFSQSADWKRLNVTEVQTYKNKLKTLDNG
jgi:hypothetical protein